MKATITAAEAAGIVEKAKEALQAAEQAVIRARDELETKQFGLLATDSKAQLAKLRKAVRDAATERDEANATLVAAQRGHAVAVAAEAHQALVERWRREAKAGQVLIAKAREVENACAQLAEMFVELDNLRVNLATELPWKPPSVELASPLWSAVAFANLAMAELYIESDGKLLNGRFALSPFELRQGPRLAARFRENVARAMSHAPAEARQAPDLLPPAA